MPTIPTGKLERELRKLFLRFIYGLSMDSSNLQDRVAAFERNAFDLIERMGGRTASLGAMLDFPAPKRLDLSPWAGTVYQEIQTAAIQASIIAGSNSRAAAQAMFRAGLDKSFRRLERLARTETTNAYWKNAFGSIADLPALVMVWGSEDGPRTCQWCRERDGLVMDSPSLRDHPNGRCTPIPTLRSEVRYRGSIDANGDIYHDPNWNQTPKEVSPVIKTPPEPLASPQAPTATVAGKKVSRRYVAMAPDGTEFVRNSIQDYSYVNLYLTSEGNWAVSQMTNSLRSAENFADRLTKKGLRNVIVKPMIT